MMYKLFSRNMLSSLRVLILNTAPGKALHATLKTWQKIPDIQLTINNFQLPFEDCEWLRQHYPNVMQVKVNPLNRSEFIEHIKKAEGYTIITTRLNVPFDQPLLRTLTASNQTQPLKILGQAGSTISHIDLATATEQGVAVTYTPGANANAVAEFVMAQIFNLTRSLIEYNQFSHDKMWSKYSIPPQEELSEKTLGLIGFGHIGRAVSMKAKALGMHVIAYARTQPKDNDMIGIEFSPTLHNLISKANIISLHLPLTSSTKRLIGEKEIASMQNGSYLINTARGEIVDEEAVAKELQKLDSKLVGVAFDVFENEGAKFQSPLIGCKRAILTPHIAGTTNTALTNVAVQLVNNIQNILLSNNSFLANPEILDVNKLSYYNN